MKRETAKSAIRRIFTHLYAVPGTFPILASINDRIDYYPLIERYVLGYTKLVFYVAERLSTILPFDWIKANVLIFEIYLASHILIYHVYKPTEERHVVWGILSVLSVFTSAVSLSVFSATAYAAGAVNLTFQLILPMVLFPLFTLFIYRNFRMLRENGNLKYPITLSAILFLVIVFSVQHFEKIYSPSFGYYTNILFSYVSQLFIIFSICFFSIKRIPGPAVVGLWFFGIISSHWVGDTLIPFFHKLADKIGI